jgi:hypothetical protein
MPWYIGVVWIFVRVQRKEQFPGGVVLLLGACYELGGDGVIGGIILPTLMGSPPNFMEFLILLPLGMFWQFIPVYSSIVLPPAWILAYSPQTNLADSPDLRKGFLPLAWMIPYLAYSIIVLLAIGFLGT